MDPGQPLALRDAMIAQRLPAGRLHLQHGPIDVVLQAWGDAASVGAAERAAAARFATILHELVAELPALRRDQRDAAPLQGAVARRMAAACAPFATRGIFVTAMAAVAGAVADELLAAMRAAAPGLRKAYVNDGGDIAVFLSPAETLEIGMVGHAVPDALAAPAFHVLPPPPNHVSPPPRPSPASGGGRRHLPPPPFTGEGRGGGKDARGGKDAHGAPGARGAPSPFDATLRLAAAQGIGGVATSGRHGRSFSLGIADAVTVLARDAATADAAATLIANAVDVASPAIRRAPAVSLDPDSDLGDLPVTVAVGALSPPEVARALDSGAARARAWIEAGLIHGAALRLAGQARLLGAPSPALTDHAA